MKINILNHKSYQQWNAYVSNSEHSSIYHLAEWADLIQSVFKHKSYFLYIEADNQIQGVLPLTHIKSALFGDFIISMPYFNYGGAIANSLEIENSLLEHAKLLAKKQGVSHIEYRDHQPRPDMPAKTDKITMILPLAASHDAQWSTFSSKLRAQIRRPMKEGIEIQSGLHEQLTDFYTVFTRNMRDLGTPVYPKHFFKEILNQFGQHCKIIIVRFQNQPVAAGFLIGFKNQLEIPWASSLRKFNHISVNMALYWEALKYAIDQGYTSFDFGRCSKNSGTYKFKKQWGAKEKQLYWHYWLKDGSELPQLNPNNPKYQLAIQTWQKLPLGITNWLGPKLVKNLP